MLDHNTDDGIRRLYDRDNEPEPLFQQRRLRVDAHEREGLVWLFRQQMHVSQPQVAGRVANGSHKLADGL